MYTALSIDQWIKINMEHVDDASGSFMANMRFEE